MANVEVDFEKIHCTQNRNCCDSGLMSKNLAGRVLRSRLSGKM